MFLTKEFIMIEGAQRLTQSYIRGLPSRENLNFYQIAAGSIVVFALVAQGNNSFQKAALATTAYGAAIAVQALVTPLLKTIADDSTDQFGYLEQSIKDFTYQVTIVSITCGLAAINPVWFGTAILTDLIWNAFIEEPLPKDKIRHLFPLVTLMQVGLI